MMRLAGSREGMAGYGAPIALLVLITAVSGCAERPSGAGVSRAGSAKPEAAAPPTLGNEDERRQGGSQESQGPQTNQDAAVEPATHTVETVDASDAEKGSRLAGRGGYLTEVLHSRFRIEHQLIFLQVKHALDLFQAEHGRFPKDHEEFMKRIIDANDLKLPELQDDWEYWYEEGELKKRRPNAPGE